MLFVASEYFKEIPRSEINQKYENEKRLDKLIWQNWVNKIKNYILHRTESEWMGSDDEERKKAERKIDKKK